MDISEYASKYLITYRLSDERFRHLFGQIDKVLGDEKSLLSWALLDEWEVNMQLTARSRLECAIACRSRGNCSASHYVQDQGLCSIYA